MLRNLKEIHRNAENWARLLSVSQRLVVLLPTAWAERRDRGLAYAALGCDDAAADDLTAYLEQAGKAMDREAIAVRLTQLARGRSRRLH
jgi:regulator of sirC expression with transglutaminase-like and TPR domain